MEHNYENEPDFIERVENAINLKPYFEICDDERIQRENIRVYDMDAKYAIDANIDEYTSSPETMQKLREMFWANKRKDKIHIFAENDCEIMHVAVHIRRPNKHDTRILGSDTPDDYYLNTIRKIRENYRDCKLRFHIYSQGELSDFEKYLEKDVVLHINEDLITTFISFVAADILVTSFSSYSYIAAILSEGIIYYHPFWHPPMKHWIVNNM